MNLFPLYPKKYPAQIISVGDGAGNILNQLMEKPRSGFRSVSVYANLDGLQGSLANVRLLVLVEGLLHGCGGNPELGKQVCEQEKERIIKVLRQGKKNIVLACLGAGLGTGAGPLIAAWSKALGLPTYAIVTLPFVFEGKTHKKVALKGLEEFRSQSISTYIHDMNTLSFNPFLTVDDNKVQIKSIFHNADKAMVSLCLRLLNDGCA